MDNLNSYKHPTGFDPKHVIMLLLGESKRQYADVLAVSHERRFPEDAEIWTCNAGFRCWQHDLLFVMDDMEQEAFKWPTYGDDLEMHDRPIITSKAYKRWVMAVDYPYDEICDALKLHQLDRYFRNTVPFMLAYALFIGVKKITIFGADYYHPSVPGISEADLANAEWWLGFLRAKGVAIELADNTTLMGANRPQSTYGYRFDPSVALDRHKAFEAEEATRKAFEKMDRVDAELASRKQVIISSGKASPMREYLTEKEAEEGPPRKQPEPVDITSGFYPMEHDMEGKADETPF